MTTDLAFTVAAAQFRACGEVGDFIDRRVRPVIERSMDKQNDAHSTYYGYLLRVTAWLRSLRKLDEPGDFQPAAAGARSLFEVAVDLALLRFDPDSPAQKLLDWEHSAILKSAHDRISVAGNAEGGPGADSAGTYRDFVHKNEARILALRQRWRWNCHPPRWTGRDLYSDAERCDRLSRSQHAAHYRLRFAELCWCTHGSAFAGIRNVGYQDFPAISAFALRDAVDFAQIAAEHVLALFGRYDASMVERFEQLKRDCAQTMAGALAAAAEAGEKAPEG